MVMTPTGSGYNVLPSSVIAQGLDALYNDSLDDVGISLESTDVFTGQRAAVARRDTITLAGGALDASFTPAVARTVGITCESPGNPGDTVTLGGLVGTIGTDFDEGADEIEFCTNLLTWAEANAADIFTPIPADFVDNADGTGYIEFVAGADANAVECSTTDSHTTIAETQAGADAIYATITIADEVFTGGGNYPSDGSDFPYDADVTQLVTALDALLPITGVNNFGLGADTATEIAVDYDAGSSAYAVPVSDDANFSAATTIDGADAITLFPTAADIVGVGLSDGIISLESADAVIGTDVLGLSQPDIVVAGAGTSGANATYSPRGEYNGRPYYNIKGQASSTSSQQIQWTGSAWYIHGIDYYSNDDVATPDLVTTWNVDDGNNPAPTSVTAVPTGKKMTAEQIKTYTLNGGVAIADGGTGASTVGGIVANLALGVNLSSYIFPAVSIDYTNFLGANLSAADFSATTSSVGVNFSYADLTGAIM